MRRVSRHANLAQNAGNVDEHPSVTSSNNIVLFIKLKIHVASNTHYRRARATKVI